MKTRLLSSGLLDLRSCAKSLKSAKACPEVTSDGRRSRLITCRERLCISRTHRVYSDRGNRQTMNREVANRQGWYVRPRPVTRSRHDDLIIIADICGVFGGRKLRLSTNQTVHVLQMYRVIILS